MNLENSVLFLDCVCRRIISFLNAIPNEAIISVPAVLATLLIPIAVFVVDREKNDVDKNILIGKVLHSKVYIVVFLIGIFSLLLVGCCKIVPLVFDAILVLFTGVIMINVKQWIDVLEVSNEDDFNYKQRLRYEYYTSQKNDESRYKIWKIILEEEKLSNQSNLMRAFVDTARQMSNSERYEFGQERLVRLLLANINKLKFYDIDDFKRIINYSLSYFEDMREWRGDESKGKIHPANAKRDLFMALMEGVIKNNNYNDYVLFEEVDEKIEAGKISVEDIIGVIFNVFKKTCNDDSVSLNGIWEGNKLFKRFSVGPDEAVSRKNFPIIREYDRTVGDILRENNKNNFDLVNFADNITENIFEKIDLIAWFDLYIFAMLPFGLNEGKSNEYCMVVNWCKYDRRCGMRGRLDSGIITLDGAMAKEERDKYVGQIIKQQYKEERDAAIRLMLNIGWLPIYDKNFVEEVLRSIKQIEDDKVWKGDGNEKLYLMRLERLKKLFERIREINSKETAISKEEVENEE